MTDIPDADFTPNPDRAIWVHGGINRALLARLEPRICALTSEGRAPITVYIDSPGGSPAVAELTKGVRPNEKIKRGQIKLTEPPFWPKLYFKFLPFCLALCGALQEGENELTGMDAFWLGLIDTVREDLVPLPTC